MMTWYSCGRHYETPVDPTQLLMIDPTKVEYRVVNKEQYFTKPDIISEVVGGEWDKHVEKIDEYDLYRAIVRRIRDGTPWEATDFYHRVKKGYETQDYDKWGCSSFEEFQERLALLDELHETIAREGYKSQRELRECKKKVPATRRIHYYWPPELHEVTIVIGRDGELIFYEGRHRLAIASALELPKIPVRVKARHSLWQEKKDKAVRGSTINKDILKHPDM